MMGRLPNGSFSKAEGLVYANRREIHMKRNFWDKTHISTTAS